MKRHRSVFIIGVVFLAGCSTTAGRPNTPSLASYEKTSCQAIALRLNSFKGKLVAVPATFTSVGNDGGKLFMRVLAGQDGCSLMTYFKESALPKDAEQLKLGSPIILKGKVAGEEMGIAKIQVNTIEFGQ